MDGVYDIADSGNYADYLPKRERLSVSLRARQDLFEGRGSITLTGLYSKRESEFDQFNTFDAVTVGSRSPYWIPGIARRSYTYVYSFAFNNNAVDVITKPVDESTNVYLDFTYDLTDEWQLLLRYTYGENESCGNCGPRTNSGVMDAGFDGITTDGAGRLYSDLFNPFLRGDQASFFSQVFVPHNQDTGFGLDHYKVKLDGPAFELPAGNVRVAFGAEHKETDNELVINSFITSVPPSSVQLRNTNSSRHVQSAFFEAHVPVLDALAVNASVRYDDYSDFGDTTNSRFAFRYDATEYISVRGSWGTAFRAPTLVETDPGILQQFRASFFANNEMIDIPVTDTRRGRTAVLNRIGNTPGLDPEEADVFSFGIDFTTDIGLSGSLTYYDVEYTDRIEELPDQAQAIATAENRSLYNSFIEVAPQPATCVEGDYGTYNPVYPDLLQSPDFRSARGGWADCDLQAIIRGGTVNVGEVDQSGIDLQLNYGWTTDIGDFSASLNVAKILEIDKTLLPGTGALDSLDKIGEQNDLRAAASIRWSRDRWSASLSARYTDSYLNDEPDTVNGVTLPEDEIPSWTTTGANVVYHVPKGEDDGGVLDGVRIGLSIDNLFDRDPPTVITSGSVRAFDVANASVFGRILSLTVQKKM